MGEFVGKRVVPDHVGVWDQKKTYEPLMIVLDGETGDSYISRKAVPVGISLADESYWSLCAHYSAQMRKLEQDVDVDVQQMHSDVTAVKNAMSQEFKETHTAISKELDDTHKAISQELSETEQRVNENLEQTSSELTGKVEQAKSDLNTGRQELKDAKDTLNKRMDSIAGGKTSDAEILDARVDSYGHTHNTLGNAIRALWEVLLPISGLKSVIVKSPVRDWERPAETMVCLASAFPVPRTSLRPVRFLCDIRVWTLRQTWS